MTLEPITSSFIEAAGYDAETKIMAVRFKNGATWHYHGVSQDEFSQFQGARSRGTFFHEQIRGKHRSEMAVGPTGGWLKADLDGMPSAVPIVKREDGSVGAPLEYTDPEGGQWTYQGTEDGCALYKRSQK